MTERCPHCQCKVESGYHEAWCEVRVKALQPLRATRLQSLRTELNATRVRLYELGTEVRRLELEEDRVTYSCPCVRLNREIAVFTSAEQERRNRNGLGCGLVSDTLSASRDCAKCHGSGVS